MADTTQSSGNRDSEGESRPLLPPRLTEVVNCNKVKLMAVRFWRSLSRKFIKATRVLDLNAGEYASLMSYISNAAVMGIVTLNIYSASYFLAWRKEGSFCHIFPESASAPVSANSLDLATSNKTVSTMIQLIVVSLPFTSLPLALGVGFLAEASKGAVHLLGCAAGLVLSEIMYIVLLGGVMTSCMSYVSGLSVAIVTLVLLVLLLLLWGCCCTYPECLRYVVFCKCCCTNIDLVELEPEEDQV